MHPLGGPERPERWEDTALGADHLSFTAWAARGAKVSWGGVPMDKVIGKPENPAHFPLVSLIMELCLSVQGVLLKIIHMSKKKKKQSRFNNLLFLKKRLHCGWPFWLLLVPNSKTGLLTTVYTMWWAF